MSQLRLYNTLSREVEDFRPPTPGPVTIYSCGPTVWNFAHIGNFRTFLLGDLLRRYLEYVGLEVFQVMNLTDVDDRTIKAASEEGHSLREHTAPFVEAFFSDRDYLRIKPADVYPQATEYIEPMVALVNALRDKGLAYTADDGSTYFAVDSFAEYGRLSRAERRESGAESRVASDEYAKEDIRDFALWKAVGSGDEEVGAAWDAPFGRGRPGWHLECSAMALAELEKRTGGRTLDIHLGGVDLIFPHHENEIAQSEGVTGERFARFWLHCEFLLMGGTKMSKRFGNYLTVRDLKEENVDPAAVRMLMFSTHYRQQLNFTDEGLQSAGEGVRRIADLRERLLDRADGAEAGDCEPAAELDREFREAMNDDLNAPKAIGAIFSFVRAVNRELPDRGPEFAAGALAALDRLLEVTQLLPASSGLEGNLAEWVEGLIEERRKARSDKDFARADQIRDELSAKGIELEDSAQGTRWKLRR